MKLTSQIIIAAAAGLLVGALATGGYFFSQADEPTVKSGERKSGGPRGRGQGRGRGGYAPAVAMAVAENAAIKKTIDVLGEARAQKSIAITSEVTGLVSAVNIAPGQRVKQGDALLKVEDEAQVIALNRARAQYPIAKANAERYRELAAENAASDLEAEQAFNALKTLEAELRSAEFALNQRVITAPFDGIAGITTIEAGDYIRPGDVITTLDDTSSIVVELAIPQESAAYVSLGQAVTANLTGDLGRTHTGEITAIDSRIDPASRTLRVEATVTNENALLLPGAVFTVSTYSDGAPALAVPGLSVQWDRAGAYVWKRDQDGKAVRASVQILQRTDNVVLVEGDLKAGDAIVADGADRVRAGVPLPGRGAKKRTTPARGGVSAAAN
ncbi:MAG: efflux RND transporter periplasmic adaptor subunit [Pseudomonadota bacterium]